MDLRILSVKQPWAGLLLSGVKKYECRGWGPRRPGVMLLHASSGKALGLPELREERLYQQAVAEAGMEDESEWTTSAIIGAVDVVRVWPPDRLPPLSAMDEFLVGDLEDSYLWETGTRWPFAKPITCHGKLNLWRPGPELQEPIRRQLAQLAVPLDRLCA